MKKISLFFLLLLCYACSSQITLAQEGEQEKPKTVALPPDIPEARRGIQTPPAAAPLCYGMPNTNYRKPTRAVEREPQFGTKITKYLKLDDSLKGSHVFYLLFNEIEFSVTIDKDGLINQLGTMSPQFSTAEGIRVGDSLKKVLEVSKGKLIRESKCVYYVILGSGWVARFELVVMPDGTLSPDARVYALMKEDLAKLQKRIGGEN